MFELRRVRRDPWSVFDEMDSLQEDMNRALVGRDWGRPTGQRRTAYPPLNVWYSEDGVVVDAELPGTEPSGVDIAVTGDTLTLKGKISTPGAVETETYHRRERPSGEFARSLQLPFRANAGGVKATYRNGVLRITVPRMADEKPRKITIEAA